MRTTRVYKTSGAKLRKHVRVGFTLIELLVVISIVSLLISFLLPALAGARKAARNMACLNQLRQITMGYFAYANMFKEAFPDTPFTPDHNFQFNPGQITGARYGGDTGGGYTDWGLLYQVGVLRDGHIAYCPSYEDYNYSNWNLPSLTNATQTSYFSRNWFKSGQRGIAITDTAGKSYGGTPVVTLESNMRYSRRSLLADVLNHYWPKTYGFVHNDSGSNVSFTDGSAQFMKWGGSYKPTDAGYMPWWGEEARVFPDIFDRRQ